jgi:hypothetical protein
MDTRFIASLPAYLVDVDLDVEVDVLMHQYRRGWEAGLDVRVKLGNQGRHVSRTVSPLRLTSQVDSLTYLVDEEVDVDDEVLRRYEGIWWWSKGRNVGGLAEEVLRCERCPPKPGLKAVDIGGFSRLAHTYLVDVLVLVLVLLDVLLDVL